MRRVLGVVSLCSLLLCMTGRASANDPSLRTSADYKLALDPSLAQPTLPGTDLRELYYGGRRLRLAGIILVGLGGTLLFTGLISGAVEGNGSSRDQATRR